jgi:hypothetical protein
MAMPFAALCVHCGRQGSGSKVYWYNMSTPYCPCGARLMG